MKYIMDNAQKIHFVGIGGIGMSSIAQHMLNKKITITGSDLSENNNVKTLKNKGITIHIGHAPENIEDNTDLIVMSSAVSDDNVEIVSARRKKIPIVRRCQLLAHLINAQKSIAIAGSHGKTTTTSLCALLLKNAGIDPNAIIGGRLRSINNNVMIGDGQYFVAEADESDGGFLLLNPYIGVITNIDNDHLGFYGSFDNEIMAFKEFIEHSYIKIVNADDPIIQKKISKGENCISYSTENKKADIYAYNIRFEKNRSIFNIKINQTVIEDVALGVLGMHNISNALAVCAISYKLNISEEILRKTFSEFTGVYRRFTHIGKINNMDVYDDYAHHPTEIKATLATASLISENVMSIFQPHRFSRTLQLMDEFAKCFRNVKEVIVLDIYAASEKPIDGVNSAILTKKINKISKNAVYIEDEESLYRYLESRKDEGILVALGAGSITNIIKRLVKRLSEN